MSYAGKFLRAIGQTAIIERDVPVETKVSIKRSTRSNSSPGAREAFWEGLILAESNLQSGEVININGIRYLVQTADPDPASGEYAFFAAKTNAVVTQKRYEEYLDENNNIVKGWNDINTNVPVFGMVVTAKLRQEDPGLLDQTRYVIQAPKWINAKLLDRIVLDGNNYQIESIDPLSLTGVLRIQLGLDVRGD